MSAGCRQALNMETPLKRQYERIVLHAPTSQMVNLDQSVFARHSCQPVHIRFAGCILICGAGDELSYNTNLDSLRTIHAMSDMP